MKVPKPTKPPKLKLRKDTAARAHRSSHRAGAARLRGRCPSHRARDALAWRLLLYVLTHGYEGRLGMEAISKRGLLYYIDGQYRSDGENAFVSLTMGVDPAKLAPMEALLREQLTLLRTNPAERRRARGSEDEPARTHAQCGRSSDEEISAKLALQWLWYWPSARAGRGRKGARPPSRRAISPKWRPRSPRRSFATVSN